MSSPLATVDVLHGAVKAHRAPIAHFIGSQSNDGAPKDPSSHGLGSRGKAQLKLHVASGEEAMYGLDQRAARTEVDEHGGDAGSHERRDHPELGRRTPLPLAAIA